MAEEPVDLERRRGLTFAQAEGVEPLPRQLSLREISKPLRSSIWYVFVKLIASRSSSMGGVDPWVGEPWDDILRDKLVFFEHGMLDDYLNAHKYQMRALRDVIENGDYLQFFGLLQWILGHRKCPDDFSRSIARVLIRERSAYRVFDDDIIAPIASAEEGEAVERAFADLSAKEYAGARAHLRAAASAATGGDWASSIRESVNAVESIARLLVPGTKEIGPALVKLEDRKVIHPALKKGFGAVYGFTSDERGLRHPLIDEPVADVDETDALFMLGACASFVSYMIGKGALQP